MTKNTASDLIVSTSLLLLLHKSAKCQLYKLVHVFALGLDSVICSVSSISNSYHPYSRYLNRVL